MPWGRVLQLGRQCRRISHGQDTSHNGMDTAVIAILSYREAGDRKLRSGRHRPRIEQAWLAILNAAVVGDGVMGRCRIVPADGNTTHHGRPDGNIIRRAILHEDFCVRGGT